MLERILAELARTGQAYVDTLEQASAVLEAAAQRWPAVASQYGWDCRAVYDDSQKRWRFQLICLSPWGVPED